MNPKDFFTIEDKKQIADAVRKAELHTSGEIVVHIENKDDGDALKKAEKVFLKLGLQNTKDRNGVLIFLALKDHSFAIIGDSGINEKVPENFWDNIKQQMELHFKSGKFTEGLCEAILESGKQLSFHFPFEKSDKNELSDEVSFD